MHPRILSVFLCLLAIAAQAEWREATIPNTGETKAPRWYRAYLRVQDNMAVPQEKDLYRDSVMLHLGGIQGPVEVLLNGRKIIEADALPADGRRRFKVPKDILQKGAFNSIILKAQGPIALAPILSGYFDEVELKGPWEVSATAPTPEEVKPLAAAPPRAKWDQPDFHNSATPLIPTELMPGAKLSPKESLTKMTPGAGLKLELIASEPDVAQPTHISFDGKGRMWVAQYRQYPFPAGLKMLSRDKYYRARFDKVPPAPPHQDQGHDIITVHEDTDGDGLYDKTKVVLSGLNMANAALHGHGGIWVMNTPYLLFYPDKDGDDVPDGDPEVRLAGFGLEDTHSVANGLAWGPDGWLYGAQGSTTTSRVVRPGLDKPDAPGVYFEGCMVWRYHPERKIYEIFAEGGGNVFGLYFDGEGRLFSGHNGGDTRGWHYVPGGIFIKQGVDNGKYGPGTHPYSFGNFDPMKSSHPVARFSHMIVIGEGNALPASMQGRILGADPLHRNVVIAERYPSGSTFSTNDSGFALQSSDPSCRPVYLANAPDGALYVADFYEEYIAHGQNYQGQIDPSTGRIYRLRGENLPLNKDTNLAAKSTPELLKYLSHPNVWHRQTAVRLIAERGDKSVVPELKKLLETKETHPALEALWALYQLGALDKPALNDVIFHHPASPVCAWAIRLTAEADDPDGFAISGRIGEGGTDAEIRAAAASAARRMKLHASGFELARQLLLKDYDIDDPYIPLLCWWTIEDFASTGTDSEVEVQLVQDLAQSKMGTKHILPRLMRRFASTDSQRDYETCAKLLEVATSDAQRTALMQGFEEAFKGRAMPALPESLVKALAKSGGLSPLLKVRLGDPKATAQALITMSDPKSKPADRLLAARLFGEVKTTAAVTPLLNVAGEGKASDDLRKAALVSLLLYDDPSIGTAVAGLYSILPEPARPAALNLLASRETWAKELARLLAAGTVKPADVPEDLAARLRSFPSLAEETARLLPPPKPGTHSDEKQAEIARIRTLLSTGAGDPYKGEPIFMARCAVCHTLFFKGGQVGPNLTSYQRDDLGTLLPSVVDPSAEIREGFENYLVTTQDGRILSGLLTDRDATGVVLRGLDGQNIRIPQTEVKETKRFERSLMPDGLLTGLTDQEIRDFFAYLRIPQPITK